MIRIAVSARAYRAIKASLPVGSVVYPPERNDRGQYLLWLNLGGGEPAGGTTPTRRVVQRRSHSPREGAGLVVERLA